MQINLSLGLSAIAILISLLSLYLQYRVKGAKIELLNVDDEQRCVYRYYDELPKTIQYDFPRFDNERTGCALVKLVFGNSGDKTGMAKIVKIEIKDEQELIKSSYYPYSMVPAFGIVEDNILLHNVPERHMPIEVEIVLTIERGYFQTRLSWFTRKAITNKIRAIILPLIEVKQVNA